MYLFPRDLLMHEHTRMYHQVCTMQQVPVTRVNLSLLLLILPHRRASHVDMCCTACKYPELPCNSVNSAEHCMNKYPC